MTKLPLFLASVFVVIAGAAVAKSPNKPPKIKWATHSGDQRVDASYLENCFQEKAELWKRWDRSLSQEWVVYVPYIRWELRRP